MNYDNMKTAPCESGCSDLVEKTLAQTLNEATIMASDVLQMAYAINQHLFGKGPIAKKDEEPKCFRDALNIHAYLIGCIAEEIKNICNSLGV